MASMAALGHRKIAQRKHFSATLVLHTFRAIKGTFARVQNVVEAGELGGFFESGFSLVPDFVGTHALFGAGGELHHDIVKTEVVVDFLDEGAEVGHFVCWSYGRSRTFCAVGLYFRGGCLRFARHLPPKTAPQRRPKGALIETLGS